MINIVYCTQICCL